MIIRVLFLVYKNPITGKREVCAENAVSEDVYIESGVRALTEIPTLYSKLNECENWAVVPIHIGDHELSAWLKPARAPLAARIKDQPKDQSKTEITKGSVVRLRSGQVVCVDSIPDKKGKFKALPFRDMVSEDFNVKDILNEMW